MSGARLGELIVPVTGRAGSAGLPVYSVTKHRGFVLSSDYFRKQVFSNDLTTYKVVDRGQFAYATIHLDEGSIGVAPEKCLISPMYTVFSIDETRADADYVIRYLKSPAALSQYLRLGRGTAERRKSISLDALGRLHIPLPPLPEQRRIAEILDEADALRVARQDEVDLIDAAVDNRIAAIVASAPTEVPFGGLLAEPLRNGISPSRGGLHEADVLTLSAITHGRFDADQRKSDIFAAAHSADKLVTEGLHLICRGNGNANLVGTMVAAPRTMLGVAFPDTMIATRPSDAIKSAALLAAWRSDRVREQIRRSARTTNGTFKINQQTLLAIRVPVGTASQQAEIEALEHERSLVRSVVRRSSKTLIELFASLQHRAFRGEL